MSVTASGHSNRFAMGRMLSADTFSYGLRRKCADLAELIPADYLQSGCPMKKTCIGIRIVL